MSDDTKNKNGGELPVLQTTENHSKSRKRKSGRGRIRACVLIAVHVAILLHITHYFVNGRSVSPVEPSETMYALELGHVNAGTIFFGLAILSTVVFGRFFCGWGCHVVALQDLSSYLLQRIGIRPKPLRSRLLMLIPFVVAFYMFCWPTVQRLYEGNRHPGFTNHLMTENFWQTFSGPYVAVFTFAVCGGLVVYLLGNKGFCTYGCPYGAFFYVSDQLAVGRIRVTDACQHCGQCTAACTSNVTVHSEVKNFGMVVDPGCMKCMDCVSVCPNDALYFGFTQKSGNKESSKLDASSKPVRKRKSYDFTLVEELFGLVVAAVVVYALRGLYDITPFLLSVAFGVITAYLAIQFLRIFRKRDLRIQNFQIKRNDRTTMVGRLAIIVLSCWFAFNVHSFLVQHYRYQGRQHLAKVTASWEELLFSDRSERFTSDERADIETAISSYGFSDRIGMMDVHEVKLGLAVANAMNGKMDVAEKYLRQAFESNPPAVREMLMQLLASQGRQNEIKEL